MAVPVPYRGLALALLRRPWLWGVAASAGLSLAPNQWWRHKPFLPLPDEDWLNFRLATAYGGDPAAGRLDRRYRSDGQNPDGQNPNGQYPDGPDTGMVDDVITWLEWRRSWR
jgi:hypothetical protein